VSLIEASAVQPTMPDPRVRSPIEPGILSDAPIILRRDYLKATLVAYQDFKKELSREAAEAISNGSDDKEPAVRLAKIENYNISIDQMPFSYIAQFGLTVRDKPMSCSGEDFST
jgi:hypothetical protein